ncbi:hypothetical protein ACFXC0_15785, partial [Streptomyces althioticus]
MAVPELIRIVSRDSPMALAQVERVRAELTAAHPGVGRRVPPPCNGAHTTRGVLLLNKKKPPHNTTTR